jgi:transposase-like protein
MTDGEYVMHSGTQCPYCQSESLYGGSFEVDGRTASQEITCQSCGKSWWDVYELKGWEPIP